MADCKMTEERTEWKNILSKLVSISNFITGKCMNMVLQLVETKSITNIFYSCPIFCQYDNISYYCNIIRWTCVPYFLYSLSSILILS